MDDEQKRAAESILRALAEAPNVHDLPNGDLKVAGEAVGDRITRLVAFLAIGFPSDDVNALMGHVWNLVGTRRAVLAIGPVPSPHVLIMRTGDAQHVVVMIFPPDWSERVPADPSHALGALVFCGSQVVDAYNGRVEDDVVSVRSRAFALEAELLRAMPQVDPNWRPNPYQQGVLDRFPDGVKTASVVDLWYERREPPAHGGPGIPE